MNIGSLYLVKELYRVLLPTKEIAVAWYCRGERGHSVSYIIPNELVVLLDKDETFLKVLTSDGRIGWAWVPWVNENYNDCFEEVKSE